PEQTLEGTGGAPGGPRRSHETSHPRCAFVRGPYVAALPRLSQSRHRPRWTNSDGMGRGGGHVARVGRLGPDEPPGDLTAHLGDGRYQRRRLDRDLRVPRLLLLEFGVPRDEQEAVWLTSSRWRGPSRSSASSPGSPRTRPSSSTTSTPCPAT